jgi:hypothetical protein
MHEAIASSCIFRLDVFAGELELLHTESFVSEPPSIYVQFLDYVPLVLESQQQSAAGASTTAAWLISCKSCSLLANPEAFAVQLSNGAISMMLITHLTAKQAQMHGSCSIAAATLVPAPTKHVLHPSTGLQMSQQWGLIYQQVSLSDIHGGVVGTINMTISLACLGRAGGAYPNHVMLQSDEDKCNSSGASCGHCVLVGEYAPANDKAEQQIASNFNQQTARVAGVCSGTQTTESEAESSDLATVQHTINASLVQQQHLTLPPCHHAVLQATNDVSQLPSNGTDQQLSQTAATQTTAAALCLHSVAIVDDNPVEEYTEVMPGNNTLHMPIEAPKGAQTCAVDYGHALRYSTKCNAGTDNNSEIIALLEAKTRPESIKATRSRLPGQQYDGFHRKHFEVQNVNQTKVNTRQHRDERIDSKQTTRLQQSALTVHSVCGHSTKQAGRGRTTRIHSQKVVRPPALNDGTTTSSNNNALIRRELFDMVQQTYTSAVPCGASACSNVTLRSKTDATVTAAASCLSAIDKSQLLQCIRAYLKHIQVPAAPASSQLEQLMSALLGVDVDVIAPGAVEEGHQQVVQERATTVNTC